MAYDLLITNGTIVDGVAARASTPTWRCKATAWLRLGNWIVLRPR
jgi:hypothetical protein